MPFCQGGNKQSTNRLNRPQRTAVLEEAREKPGGEDDATAELCWLCMSCLSRALCKESLRGNTSAAWREHIAAVRRHEARRTRRRTCWACKSERQKEEKTSLQTLEVGKKVS